MSSIVFLSDVHLSETRSDITQAFIDCIDTLCALSPEGVFILGDLFNAWIGDEIHNNYIDQITSQIKKLSVLCPVFFQRGNRDFLISKIYAQKSGMTLLPDSYQFELDGQNLLLQHGDLLCTDDISYQKMRKILRSKWLTKLASITPLWFKQFIANQLRKKSQQYTQQKSMQITDVNPESVRHIMQSNNIHILIHGHTHRPDIEKISENQTRYILGDWRPQGEILIYQNGKWTLDFLNQIIQQY